MKHILVALGAFALLAGLASATAGPFDTYVGSGTLVVNSDQTGTVLDEGGTICNKSTALPSIGGGCVLFGPWDSILVNDVDAGTQVAFQVCIDNNGDGICGRSSLDFSGAGDPCSDGLFFSHDNAGNFFNPLGPLPTGFTAGCPGGAWPGYVVLLCQGVHNVDADGDGVGVPHTHGVTSGTISGAFGGTGFGDFCLPPEAAPPKPYLVQ